MHKAVWIGPEKRVHFDPVLVLAPGDEFNLPTDVILGGEGTDYHITGGPGFDAALSDAKAMNVKGHTKMTTRLDLELAAVEANEIATAKAEAEEAAKAEVEAAATGSEE